MGLIVAGGIGFIVHYELHLRVFGKQRRLSVHTKGGPDRQRLLIVVGAVLFFVFENDRILKDLPWQNRLLASLFQSITRAPRFQHGGHRNARQRDHSADDHPVFIGASPGSTGGGVKTTSASLLFLIMWSRLRGREDVTFSTVPYLGTPAAHDLHHAGGDAVHLLHHVGPVAVGGSQRRPVRKPPSFRGVCFRNHIGVCDRGAFHEFNPEPEHTPEAGIILMMFAGRVGPLTLAFSLARMVAKRSFAYAEEGVMVG